MISGYIPQKDRQEAADNLVSVLVDLLADNELQEFLRPDYYFQLGFKTRDYDRKLGNMEYVKQNQAILANSENIISRIQPKSIL